MNTNRQSLRHELESLLSESIAAAKHREQSAFDELVSPFNRSLILFGAGNLGRKILKALRLEGIEPLGFADNNPALWGQSVEGVTVFSPKDAAERFGKNAAVIMTIWRALGSDTMAERCKPLLDFGCTKVIHFGTLFWKFPHRFLPHYGVDLPHKILEQSDKVLHAFDLWEDDASRAEFVSQIRWRLTLDFDALTRPVQHQIYFPDDLVQVSKNEVLVDCGAFNGDTLDSFLKTYGDAFGQYIALEADPLNFDKLRQCAANQTESIQNKIVLFPLAVGARREKVCFSATGNASAAVGEGDLEIECAPLDEIIAANHPTWIKMDIEGSEPDALEGARVLIKQDLPVLAICVYHLQNHIWSIPLWIQPLSEDYRFFLRPHDFEGWDLVCYAIPKSRL